MCGLKTRTTFCREVFVIALLASFAGVMTTIGYIVLALVVLLVMITIHEAGHYTFGKIFKFKINEFSIGFGKAIFKKKLKSGEDFSIRIIPLGGYCAFAGEDEDDTDPNAFNNKAPWKRLIVQFGGVLFNFLSAIIFAFILLLAFGYDVPKVSEVNPNFQEAGVLQTNDIIREIDDTRVDFVTGNTANKLLNSFYIDMTAEEKALGEAVNIEGKDYTKYTNLPLTIERDGVVSEVMVNFYISEVTSDIGETSTSIAVGFGTVPYQHTFGEAIARSVPLAAGFAWQVLVFLGQLFTGGIGLSDIGGPLTTISTIADYSQQNIANLFVFLPFIAANLAIFNLLPIPALDGSRMVFTTIEWIRGKPVNRKVEGQIHFWGMVVLFALVIFVDVYNLIF